jgi:protein-S-isoprenylcysteine O-methyltransferase Ste14
MTGSEIHASKVPWPPLIYLSAIAISVLLGVLYPLPWIADISTDFMIGSILSALGWIVLLAAIALWFSAISAMRKARTPIHPGAMPQHLLTKGAFGISRNPIYLSATLLMIGLALALGNLWFVVLAFVAGFTTGKVAIRSEEKRLALRFGKKYHDYAKRVRRWL